jgi:hypothetical protein
MDSSPCSMTDAHQRFSESSVKHYQIAWHHMPEDGRLIFSHSREDLKPHIFGMGNNEIVSVVFFPPWGGVRQPTLYVGH